MRTIKLLLIEDDVDLGYILKSSMEDVIGGYEVDIAVNGKEGLEFFDSFIPDVIVSDIMLPGMTGLEMVKMIRQKNRDIPIIFATGKNMPKDVIKGYETGANFYIKKPFAPQELDAHIKSLLDTINGSKLRLMNNVRKIGKYTFDPNNRLLVYNDSEKKVLTTKESQILEILSEHKGEIVKRAEILDILWENWDANSASASLNVFITKLRQYLSKDPSITITSIKSIGLMLDLGKTIHPAS